MCMCVCVQDLKGRILLKGKKIGGLEGSMSGVAEDSLTGEVSDEDEGADIDEDNHHNDSIRRRTKVSMGRTIHLHLVIWQMLLSKATYKGVNS